MNYYCIIKRKHFEEIISVCFILIIVILLNTNNIMSLDRVYNSKDSSQSYSRIGFIGGVSLNYSTSDLRGLPTMGDSVEWYADGYNTGFYLGGLYEYNLSKRVAFQFRGIYLQNNTEIRKTTNYIRSINNVATDVTLENVVKSNISGIYLEPMFKLRTIYNLAILAGFDLGCRLKNSFDYTQTIKSPDGVYFSGTNKSQKLFTDSKISSAFQAALNLGACYDFTLDKQGRIVLSLEALYSWGYADLIDNLTIDANSFRTGITIKYSFQPTKFSSDYNKQNIFDTVKIESETINSNKYYEGRKRIIRDTLKNEYSITYSETTYRTDTLYIPKPKIEKPIVRKQEPVQVWAYALKNGVYETTYSANCEEFPSTKMQPLLNYIFFDFNSSNIPARYKLLNKDQAKDFVIDSLYNNTTLEAYYNILNIVGKRLQAFPKAKIVIMGCNNGFGDEFNHESLSADRVNTIANYFKNVWGIDDKRFDIRLRNLPEKPSSIRDADGMAENQRVELFSNSEEITKPIVSNYKYKKFSPDVIYFQAKIDSNIVPKSCNLIIKNKQDTILDVSNNDICSKGYYWKLNQEENQDLFNDSTFEFYIEVTDNENKVYKSDYKIFYINNKTIEEKKLNSEGNIEIDKYSLILFDFNESDLSASNKKIIDFINSKLKDNSKVLVEGLSDRTGDDDHNLELSKQRANNVGKVLNLKNKNDENLKCIGLGETNLIYDNSMPEGRFYCRTVIITVETPIK